MPSEQPISGDLRLWVTGSRSGAWGRPLVEPDEWLFRLGMEMRLGRRLSRDERAVYNWLRETGIPHPPLGICKKCGRIFRPRRKLSARMCSACNHRRSTTGPYEGRCERCRGGFTAPTRARRQCENCRREKARLSKGWLEPIPRSYRFVREDRSQEGFTVTVSRGDGHAVTVHEHDGVIETTDAEATRALEALHGLVRVA